MDIKIFDKREIKLYEPKDKSYLIRISSMELRDFSYINKYVDKREFYFEDLDYENDYTITDKEIAEIISFVKEAKNNNCEEIIIHCDYGKSRSPAVGIFIGERFFNSDFRIRILKPEYNKFILDKLNNFK
jgi:predicted protein tyrosine phosphatase